MDTKFKRLTVLLSATALSLTAGQATAWAQEAEARAATEVPDRIVVTALRRDSSVQDVPAQVTVLNSAAIENRGIDRPADFIAQVPNVTFVETQNAGTSFLVIRGIGQNRNSEPSAAIVIDGIPLQQPALFNQSLVDIGQIEVLKGPQGALYGRNAIGGAIVITTTEPGDTFEGRLLAGVDSGPGYRLQGAATVPLSDALSMRAALSWYDTDGYLTNVNTADATAEENADPVEDLNARVSFRYEPNDQFRADLRLSANLLDTRGLYYVIPDFADPNFNNPNFTGRDIDLNNSGVNERDIYDVALRLSYDTDAGEFASITGFNSLEELLTGDGYPFDPFGPFPINRTNFNFNQSQFLDVDTVTQEFRFTSPSDQRFRWIAGTQFYSTDRFISTGNMIDTGNGVFPVYGEPTTNPLNPQLSFLADSQDQFAWAVYLNTSFDLNDVLELSVNARYDNDTRENTTVTPAGFLPCTPGPDCATGAVREETWDDFQPQIILSYSQSSNLTLFASYSRGFRSGGFNQTGVGAVANAGGFFGVGDVFDQETANTFEAGFKSTLMDGRVNLNASAFSTISEGSYYFIFIAANSTQNLGNIDEVEYRGVDLELTAELAEGLNFNAGIGFTDSEITEFPDPVAIGAKAPQVSDYTINMGLEYTVPVTNTLDAFFRVDYNRLGDTTFTIPFSAPSLALDATPVARDPVDLVDVRASLRSDSWAFTVWAKNLFDEEYNAEYSTGGFLFRAQPQRYGADISYRF